MAQLTRRILEKAVKEGVLHMPIIVGTKGRDWEVEVRGMSIDVIIDALAEEGVTVDETMTDAEVAAITGV